MTMTPNNQFLTDLERGKKEEIKVFEHFKKSYPDTKIVNGYKKEFDIEIPEKFCVEVKFDERSINTGNYFIEAFYENSPSGINSTTAKLWVISNGKQYLFVNTKEIKNCIKEWNLKLRTAILFGKVVKFYLIKKHLLEYNGKFIQLD